MSPPNVRHCPQIMPSSGVDIGSTCKLTVIKSRWNFNGSLWFAIFRNCLTRLFCSKKKQINKCAHTQNEGKFALNFPRAKQKRRDHVRAARGCEIGTKFAFYASISDRFFCNSFCFVTLHAMQKLKCDHVVDNLRQIVVM